MEKIGLMALIRNCLLGSVMPACLIICGCCFGSVCGRSAHLYCHRRDVWQRSFELLLGGHGQSAYVAAKEASSAPTRGHVSISRSAAAYNFCFLFLLISLTNL